MTVGSCLHETVSAVRCLGIAHSETHGFRATRRSLAALPLKVESSYFCPTFLYLSRSRNTRSVFSVRHAQQSPTQRTGSECCPDALRIAIRCRKASLLTDLPALSTLPPPCRCQHSAPTFHREVGPSPKRNQTFSEACSCSGPAAKRNSCCPGLALSGALVGGSERSVCSL